MMTKEKMRNALNGWMMAGGVACLMVVGAACCLSPTVTPSGNAAIVVGLVLIVIGGLLCPGFFSLQPNEAAVLLLYGQYKGTLRNEGLSWVNPLFNIRKISLRARTLNGEKLKVNDKRGNPIEVAAVIVWRVRDTARAVFDVDNYAQYVLTQSETSLRHLASLYNYDQVDNESSLLGSVQEITEAFRSELQERLSAAGIDVDEARLTHLAYAAEIAVAMLRRQQAEAVIAARQKIVYGAVSMVSMALRELAEKNVVTLDEERKAAMVSNLLVVLCAESEAQPVINTGTLYT